jgi:hypothetical protein
MKNAEMSSSCHVGKVVGLDSFVEILVDFDSFFGKFFLGELENWTTPHRLRSLRY